MESLFLFPIPQKEDKMEASLPLNQTQAPQHRVSWGSLLKPSPWDLVPGGTGWIPAHSVARGVGLGLVFYLQPLPETTLGLSSPHRARGPIISDIPEDSPSPEGTRLSPSSGGRR